MIRQPSIDATVALLEKAFADNAVIYGHQRLLNLAAQTHGYKNYAHYKAETDRKVELVKLSGGPTADSPTFVPSEPINLKSSREEALETALEWVALRLESVLAGKPVRDADECLVHAKLLLKPSNT